MLQTGVISLNLPHAFAGAWGLHTGRAGRAALVMQWEDKLPGPLLCDRHSQMQCGERCRPFRGQRGSFHERLFTKVWVELKDANKGP